MEEISVENRAELEKRYKTTVFIVSAQILSAVFLSIAAFFITRTARPAAENSYLTLWLVILFLAMVTFVLRRLLFNWERLKNAALLKGVPGLLNTLRINTIFLNLFGEIIIVIGFVIAFLNADFFDMLRAAGVAVIVFALNFPRFSIWEKIVSNLEKV